MEVFTNYLICREGSIDYDMDDGKKLGILAFIPKNIFQNITYICLFTEKQLLVIEDDNINDFIEDDSNSKKSFFERIKEAFMEKEVSYNLSEEKMLMSGLVKIYNRANTSNVCFNTLNNQLRFYSDDEKMAKVLNFDYNQEEIITYTRKIFGITDKNIE